jgi:hypothetical protein
MKVNHGITRELRITVTDYGDRITVTVHLIRSIADYGDSALNSLTAITRGNTIYVRPSSWNSVTNAFAGPTFFEEVLHSVQYSRSGTSSFNVMYGLGYAMAKISGIKDGYPNHIEIEEKGFASKLWNDYRSLSSAQRC